MVDGTTTDAIAIGQLTLGVVLRHVDNQRKLMLGNHVHHIVLAFFVGPADSSSCYTIVIEELGGTTCGIYLVPLLDQLLSGLQQRYFTLGCT